MEIFSSMYVFKRIPQKFCAIKITSLKMVLIFNQIYRKISSNIFDAFIVSLRLLTIRYLLRNLEKKELSFHHKFCHRKGLTFTIKE